MFLARGVWPNLSEGEDVPAQEYNKPFLRGSMFLYKIIINLSEVHVPGAGISTFLEKHIGCMDASVRYHFVLLPCFVLICDMTRGATGSMVFGFLILAPQGIQWENPLITGGAAPRGWLEITLGPLRELCFLYKIQPS